MQKLVKKTALEPTNLIAPQDLHIVDPGTKIAIRMREGVERIVPPAFVGLALSAGALPPVMYKEQYGQYRDIEGKLQGELKLVHDDEDDFQVMPERLSVEQEEQLKRAPMKDETPDATEEEILKAIDSVLKLAAAKPDNRNRYLTADGVPKIPALEEVLGKDITAAQRDAAWETLNPPMNEGG